MNFLCENVKFLPKRKLTRNVKILEPIFFYTIPHRQRASMNDVIDKDEYEYIQRSKVPTMHFQKSLPRLPIPKLEESCKRYLRALQPILTESEWQQSSANVAEFLKKDGPYLHQKIIEKDTRNKHTSYICEPWFDMYLRDRKPLPINYNPTLVFVQESNEQYNKPLIKGTNLLISSARFIKSLRKGILAPEVFHIDPKKSDTPFFWKFTGLLPSAIATYGAYLFNAFPLDMSQYLSLFGTTRVPALGKDIITHEKSSRHIVVMRKGHFYSMDLLNTDGQIRRPIEIASCLNTIMKDTREPNQCPLGVLTTADRDDWSKIRQHLVAIGNENILKKIDSALFVFILDDEDKVETDYNKLIRLFLHGDGTNRWFDKSFSLIMANDGTAGINFEHSWGDGVAVLRYFKDLKHDITDKPKFHPENESDVSNNPSSVERLEFTVDDEIKEAVNKIFTDYKTWTLERLTVDYLICDEFGKEECKKFGVSPDAVMQLAFQLALFKKEARSVATYESCSTAAFKHGRTETVRSCTNETKALCSAILARGGAKVNDDKLKKLILECSKAHLTLIKEAAMGQGFDRHLFALKNLWETSEKRDKMPAIFQDPAYAKINHNILSTSTLSSPEVMAGGFGPVVDDGYGIAYMIQDHKLGSVVTSYRQHRDATEYVSFLKSAFEDIRRILKSK
ncbi:carnitine O-palmitoyltransferase 2, mitochondrial [Chelonus insularis]|uniref:carnitine O-palmitoyltransferase 2, mitochondrial n=1 Tax=Chelonus insularis TaxID=460826 RepID=UPI00158D5B93|nr:carnitine O-palmitoyltransferase 2, mitochondrial [Chelonus insularis]